MSAGGRGRTSGPEHPDVDDHQDDQLNEEVRAVRDEHAEAFQNAPEAVEGDQQREDPKQDQQPAHVPVQQEREVVHGIAWGQFTPTTWSFATRSTKPTMKSDPSEVFPVTR